MRPWTTVTCNFKLFFSSSYKIQIGMHTYVRWISKSFFSLMYWWNVSVHVVLYIGAVVTNIVLWLLSATVMCSHKHYIWMVLCLHELMSHVISNCSLEKSFSYKTLIGMSTYILWISKSFFPSWTDEIFLFMSLFILVLKFEVTNTTFEWFYAFMH